MFPGGWCRQKDLQQSDWCHRVADQEVDAGGIPVDWWPKLDKFSVVSQCPLSFLHGIMSWIFRDVSDIGLQGVSEQDDRGRLHAAWLTQRSWLDAKFHQAEGDSRGRIDDFKEYHTVSCPQPARTQSCYISAQSYTSHLLVSFWSALTSKTWRFVLSFWRTCYNTDSTGIDTLDLFFGFREGLDTSETSFFGSLGWRNKSALPYNHLHCTYWTESCLLRKILSPWHGFFEFIFFWVDDFGTSVCWWIGEALALGKVHFSLTASVDQIKVPDVVVG